jgi:hypothetical protein
MAVIKVVNSKASIGKAINYVTKGEKTEEKLISGKDCNPHTAIDEMKATKEQWGKTEGRQYKHYIQSFNPEDRITPEKAHEIGRKFVENTEKFKGHEVVIATHVDKGHIHNHFIVNSVNFENGKKFQQSKKDLEKLKNHSDRICEREGLSIIKEKGKEITAFDQKKYKAIEKGFTGKEKSYLLDTAIEVSNSLKKATSREEFIKDMESKGYKVNWKDTRKHITFTTPEGKKVRNSNLEKTFKEHKFSKEGMENEIQRNRERREPSREQDRGQDREQPRANGLNKGNERTQQAHAELHKGTHERGHSNENDNRRGAKQDKNNQSRDTRQNGFDFEKARNHAEQLRRETASAYGKWKDGNTGEQSKDLNPNERDREHSKSQHGRDERKHGKELERVRTKDFDLSR